MLLWTTMILLVFCYRWSLRQKGNVGKFKWMKKMINYSFLQFCWRQGSFCNFLWSCLSPHTTIKNKERAKRGIVEWMNFYLNRFKDKWIKEILYYVYVLRFTFLLFWKRVISNLQIAAEDMLPSTVTIKIKPWYKQSICTRADPDLTMNKSLCNQGRIKTNYWGEISSNISALQDRAKFYLW